MNAKRELVLNWSFLKKELFNICVTRKDRVTPDSLGDLCGRMHGKMWFREFDGINHENLVDIGRRLVELHKNEIENNLIASPDVLSNLVKEVDVV